MPDAPEETPGRSAVSSPPRGADDARRRPGGVSTTAAPLDPAQEHAVRESFARQGMMAHLGVQMLSIGVGEAVLSLPHSERVTQQQGGFHGGAMGALADIAGGYAAMTVAPPGSEVTTVEYKINFLASHTSGELVARGRVLRAGRRIIVTSAEVVHRDAQGRESPCAVMQQTIVPVTKTY